MMKNAGVETMHGKVTRILSENGAVTGVETDKGKISCGAVIVCTGGKSYPATGSTGDGYRFAREFGHTIVKPMPSLVPLESDDDYCAEMQGFSLKNVTLNVFNGKGEKIFSELGEMLFTHFGVSGPLVLSASAHMRDFDNDTYRLSIDLKPGLDEQKLDARILRDFEKYRNRSFANSLGDLAGRSMIPVLVRLSGIPADTQVNSITRAQRLNLVQLFKAFPVSISGPRPISEAIVTTGGVDVKEVDPRTMASRLATGLYFAGEVLDVDAYTGGFNLQIAWSTAHTAGLNVEPANI
jgi:predicted Rossmann fold flavoprotein